MAIEYENAPITEAVIDLRVKLSPGVTLASLENLHNSVKARYPGKKKRLHVHGEFSAGDQLGAAARQETMGFAFESESGKEIFQARLDGFTFSRLRPYGNWPELRDEAQRLWSIYRSAADPVSITRVAV